MIIPPSADTIKKLNPGQKVSRLLAISVQVQVGNLIVPRRQPDGV